MAPSQQQMQAARSPDDRRSPRDAQSLLATWAQPELGDE